MGLSRCIRATRWAGSSFTEEQREQIKRIAPARPEDHKLPFSTWSLAKLADYLADKGVVEDISHERLRTILREQGVSFQRIKTWKESTDPDFETKKERVLDLYALADGKRECRPDDPDEVICLDEFGPLNLQPQPGRQWACQGGRGHPAAGGDEPPFTGSTASGTCSPPTTSAPIGSTGTSSRASAAASSSRSCGTCGRFIHSTSG